MVSSDCEIQRAIKGAVFHEIKSEFAFILFITQKGSLLTNMDNLPEDFNLNNQMNSFAYFAKKLSTCKND